MRGHHHQHRQHPGFAGTDRYPHLREPQITLRLITGLIRDPVSRISRGILGPDPGNVLPEPRRRPRPAHPFSQHRRRHPRVLQQQRTNSRFHSLDTRVLRRPNVRWRTLRADCLRDGVPGDPQPRRYRPHRFTLGQMQPPNKRPILHCDHPPNRLERVAQFSTVTMAHFSTITDTTPQPDVRQLLQSRQNRVRKPASAHVQSQVLDANLTAVLVAEVVSTGAWQLCNSLLRNCPEAVWTIKNPSCTGSASPSLACPRICAIVPQAVALFSGPPTFDTNATVIVGSPPAHHDELLTPLASKASA